MPRLTTCTPSYRRHRSSGQAVVTLNGRDHYLGKYGTPESKAAYKRLMTEWLVNQRQLPIGASDDRSSGVTINELFLAYWSHAQSHYRKNGKPTSQLNVIKSAARPLVELYGGSLAAAYGP